MLMLSNLSLFSRDLIAAVKPLALAALVIGLAVAVTNSHAQSSLNLFEDQRVVYSSELKERMYFLALGPLQKIDGKWSSEREEGVRSRVDRNTYEITHPFDLKSAWQEVQAYFAGLNASLVYQCSGLACGSSNAWANERFDVPLLYGLDLSQQYQVWQWPATAGGEKNRVAAVYLVQRGNKRIYFHIDELWPSKGKIDFAPSASVIAERFYADGRITVSGLTFENGNVSADEKHIKALARALNEKPFLRLSIVGHDYFPGSEAEQKQRSLAYAEEVMNLLKKQGVRARRMEAEGLGALTPNKINKEAQVDVLLRAK